MQPMLFVTSAIRGLFYLNGRLIGDMEPDRPLCLPAAPGGALYVEFRPLEAGYLSLARCLVPAGAAWCMDRSGDRWASARWNGRAA